MWIYVCKTVFHIHLKHGHMSEYLHQNADHKVIKMHWETVYMSENETFQVSAGLCFCECLYAAGLS
jgi:hypothetical protein